MDTQLLRKSLLTPKTRKLILDSLEGHRMNESKMIDRSIRCKSLISEVRFRALILQRAVSTNNATQKSPMSKTISLRVPKEETLLAKENVFRTNGKEPSIVLISIWSKRVGLVREQEMVEENSKR